MSKTKKEKRIGEFVALNEKSLLRLVKLQHKIFLQWKKKQRAYIKKMRKIYLGQ